MLLYILGVIVVLILGLLAYASTKPDEFRFERSIEIKAPAEKIFPQLNNFRHWRNWSPWENLDPNLQREYSGPESGVGAIYAWQGNKKVGKGRMEIIEATGTQKLRIQLDFIEPFPSNNFTEFTLHDAGSGTHINWSMTGKHIFLWKFMSIFISMDKMIGKAYEAGLNKLKHISEANP
jgi:hypothetical protein